MDETDVQGKVCDVSRKSRFYAKRGKPNTSMGHKLGWTGMGEGGKKGGGPIMVGTKGDFTEKRG